MDNNNQALLLNPYLTAYFNRRDNALGFIQPSFITRQAVSYHYTKQAEIEQQVTASASKFIKLKLIQAEITRIIREAETATTEHRKELLAEARRLRKQAKDG